MNHREKEKKYFNRKNYYCFYLLTYLKLTNKNLGLLLNSNVFILNGGIKVL